MQNESVVIAVRVDAGAHETIKRAAKHAGLPMSSYMRMATLKHAQQDLGWAGRLTNRGETT